MERQINVSVHIFNQLQPQTALFFVLFLVSFCALYFYPILSRVWCWTVAIAHHSRIKIRFSCISLRCPDVSFCVRFSHLLSFHWTPVFSSYDGIWSVPIGWYYHGQIRHHLATVIPKVILYVSFDHVLMSLWLCLY